MQKQDLQKQLVEHLPPVFAGTSIDRLTGDALKWRTIQNNRANRNLPEDQKIPAKCFIRQGNKKILIVRDNLLDWWLNNLS